MGFADFLATVGSGRTAGKVGEYFGGQTTGQRSLQAFIDNDLPNYAQAIEATTDPRELEKIGLQFLGAASKSGMPAQAVEKIMDLMIEPARKGLNVKQAGDVYGQMANEMSPLSEPRPQGVEGPLNASGAFLERPGRQPHAGDAMRLAETEARTGVKIPAHLAGLLQAPSVIQENTAQAGNYEAEASKRKTEQNILDQQSRALEGLPENPIGDTGMTTRSAGLATRGTALSGLFPKKEDSLVEDRRKLIQEQTRAASRSNQPGTSGESYSETVTEPNKDVMDRQLDERAFARAAVNRGINKMPPEQQGPALQKLANEMNYDLTGAPTLNVPAPQTSFFGLRDKTNPKTGEVVQDPPTLTGTDFSFTPRPQTKTTTRGRGNQPAQAQAGGKPLDDATAAQIFEKAGRDPKRAAAMAKQMGYRVD